MNIKILISDVIDIIILIYHVIPRIYNWFKYHKRLKNIIFRILPEKVINVPVDGRKLILTLSNRNKNFDVDMKIILEFPDFLEIHKSSNFYPEDELEFHMENETLDATLFKEKIGRKFEDKIKIISMGEWRTTFKLLPKCYRRSGIIIYKVSLGVKDLDGKIKVNT